MKHRLINRRKLPSAAGAARNKFARSGTIALAALTLSGVTFADPVLRVQFNQRGDFVMIGNSSGYDCGGDAVAPIVGDVACPGSNINDSAPDLFWQSEEPGTGEATASGMIAPADARSTAMLSIPAGARISYARLYWSGYVASASGADTAVTFSRPGGDLDETISADQSWTGTSGGPNIWYQSTADVTDLLKEHEEGAYRVGGIASVDFRATNIEDPVMGWVLVVMYRLNTDPPRNLTIFDGFDRVQEGADAQVTLDGFLVPNAGYDAKLGVITYEGDASLDGDSLLFNNTLMSDAVNAEDNFFNGSRSYLGVPVTVPGDLPQLSGAANSMGGIDFDVIDIAAEVAPGDTSATIEARTDTDRYFLGAFVTSISMFRPDFTQSNKAFVDLNGQSVLPGDVLEYTITTQNDGNDSAINTVMTDPLPAGLEYVPDSIKIVTGMNVGAKTDAAGDDEANYDEASGSIVVRLGEGATATAGGTVLVGEQTVVVFRAKVTPDAPDKIVNQAIITAEGALGASSSDYPTDGNGDVPGVPPTETPVGRCNDDDDCAVTTPICDDSGAASVCVECESDSDCGSAAEPDCTDDGLCGCDAGAGECATDSDDDGLADDDEEKLGSDPEDADSDDDGVPDGEELVPGDDSDGDGLVNLLDSDSDNDGLFDGTEMGYDCEGADTSANAKSCRADADKGATTTNPLDPDTDHGGVSDGSEDTNLNGRIDGEELDPNDTRDDDSPADSDDDGLSDDLEETIGSDPKDADSDDDGVPDGNEPNPSSDTDGDGLINALDPDSDNDGLFDGTEMGLDCSGSGTSKAAGHCRADADKGATTTSALNPDTDGGGVSDGAEDFDLDGQIDKGEGDPNDAKDDQNIVDTDGDGLSDGVETDLGSDPNDADSDDDGVPDGLEPNPSDDTDGDGLITVLDPDSDNDGLFDGTEMGFACDGKGTTASRGHCRADADDGETKTNPLDPDTDHGGVTDGSEDTNLNGRLDKGELDPNDDADDADVKDTDGDGLSDDLEEFLGSDPEDGDSDDDGVPDGDEANLSDDTDGDGLTNVLDPDSDNDGLFDGTESGRDCKAEGTDPDSTTCIPDADKGETTTGVLDPDTDGGGVRDGDEDKNRNGRVDEGESDPLDASDDLNLPTGVSLEGGGCGCRTAQNSPGSWGVIGFWGLVIAGLVRVSRRRKGLSTKA